MMLRALHIYIGNASVGTLFQYGEGDSMITRLKPDLAFWQSDASPVLSWAARTDTPEQRLALVRSYTTQGFFNGVRERLPAFFQNLLPEGPLRTHLVDLRGCAPDDHFDLLAMCGTDLPGNVWALPAQLTRHDVADIVTQQHDALEMSVVDMPVEGAVSLSGVQPKLALVLEGGRYVARTKIHKRMGDDAVHIIAKLPTVQYPLLPEVEELSLRMARVCGVDVCEASLAPLASIAQDIPFVIGQEAQFLAVRRFDRVGQQHVHCEDFAQVLGENPWDKYRGANASYAAIALVLRDAMGLGDGAVHELMRRIMVNELLGNYDAHLKNFGVLYADGRTPALSPAYDVVAYSAYMAGRGHALKFTPNQPRHARLTPAVVRDFCNRTGLLEAPLKAVLKAVVVAAAKQWPAMIDGSQLLPQQKQSLTKHLLSNPAYAAMLKRSLK
jgi:serine/threonine-protein kinase HipA